MDKNALIHHMMYQSGQLRHAVAPVIEKITDSYSQGNARPIIIGAWLDCFLSFLYEVPWGEDEYVPEERMERVQELINVWLTNRAEQDIIKNS